MIRSSETELKSLSAATEQTDQADWLPYPTRVHLSVPLGLCHEQFMRVWYLMKNHMLSYRHRGCRQSIDRLMLHAHPSYMGLSVSRLDLFALSSFSRRLLPGEDLWGLVHDRLHLTNT